MSERQAKKARRREQKQLEKATTERKATSFLRRRRVTLIALAAGVMLLGVSIFNGTREARVTILNHAGVPLKDVKIDYHDGSKTVASIEPGEKLSIPLIPEGPAPANWPKGLVAIEMHRDDDAPLRFRSFAGTTDSKLHQVFTATSLPDGRLNLTPVSEGGGGPTLSFRALLRSIGIGQ